MSYLKRLGKFILISGICIIVLGIILNTLYFFDIISSNIYNIMKLIIVLGTLFVNALLFGKNSKENGFILGLKLGAIYLVFMIIVKLVVSSSFDKRTFLYSLIILLVTSIGSFSGIRKKKK